MKLQSGSYVHGNLLAHGSQYNDVCRAVSGAFLKAIGLPHTGILIREELLNLVTDI